MSTTHVSYAGEHSARLIRRVLLALAAVALFAALPFLSGLIGALILFVLARPLHERLVRRIPPRISAFVLALAALGVFLVPGAWLLGTIIAEGTNALRSLQTNGLLARTIQTPIGPVDLGATIANAGSTVLGWLSGRAVALVGGATATILNILIALFGLYYLLIDEGALWRRITRLLPGGERTGHIVADRFQSVNEALLLGTGLTAVLQGTVVGVAFAILGFRAPVLWGFVTACVSVLPLLGSALVWLPGVGVLLIAHRTIAAVVLAVIGAGVASNIDNVARLVVFRRVSGIHPMLTLIGAFAGVRLLGAVGAFVGPLVLSFMMELLRGYEDMTSVPEPIMSATRGSAGRTSREARI
ncbi:MAG TPA: AI-2E family transporter [Gemmatimonadaceae bacterium]